MRACPKHLIILGLLARAGCDGHARTLYLKPSGTPKPRWSVASVTIPIAGQEDVMGIVSAVAADRGLSRDKEPRHGSDASWTLNYSDRPNTWFKIAVKREDEGYWSVALLDWPTFVRTKYSVNAERAIRDALTAPAR
jgi:hypothetical protein